jgi:hypothetical protein
VGGGSYLDVEVLVNLHCFAKDEDELHHTGKFPHIAYFLDKRDFSRMLGGLHLGVRALEISRTHGEGRDGPRRRPLIRFSTIRPLSVVADLH